MLGEEVEAAEDIGKEADECYITGQACELTYDKVRRYDRGVVVQKKLCDPQ